jgi:hypothetical protein
LPGIGHEKIGGATETRPPVPLVIDIDAVTERA